MALKGDLSSLSGGGGGLTLAPSGHHPHLPVWGPWCLMVETLLFLHQIHQRGPFCLYLMVR